MKKEFKLILFALSLVTYEVTTYAANDMIMPGMLMVAKEFNSPVSYVALSLSLFLLGNALSQLFVGVAAERYGKRKVIITGNIIFLLFTIFLTLSVNMKMFLLGRLLQGTGIAFIAMGYALIHENFNDKNAVKIISIMANISILAPILGPVIGGFIVSALSWRFVFACSLFTGLISLYGLYKYTPINITPLQRLNLKGIISTYRDILSNRVFIIGTVAIGCMIMPSMLWIAFAPTLIMHTLKLSINHYMGYQAIAVGGFMISTIINQLVAGKIGMVKLIRSGTIVSVGGFIIMAIFVHSILAISIGMCISCVGLGLQLGTMSRIMSKLEVKSQSMLFSLIAFVQALFMTVFIEISNNILNIFEYSLISFVSCSLIFGIISIVFVLKFTDMNKERNWQ